MQHLKLDTEFNFLLHFISVLKECSKISFAFLGGSSSTGSFDNFSDYDIYVCWKTEPSISERKNLLNKIKRCDKYTEIRTKQGNNFKEYYGTSDHIYFKSLKIDLIQYTETDLKKITNYITDNINIDFEIILSNFCYGINLLSNEDNAFFYFNKNIFKEKIQQFDFLLDFNNLKKANSRKDHLTYYSELDYIIKNFLIYIHWSNHELNRSFKNFNNSSLLKKSKHSNFLNIIELCYIHPCEKTIKKFEHLYFKTVTKKAL